MPNKQTSVLKRFVVSMNKCFQKKLPLKLNFSPFVTILYM